MHKSNNLIISFSDDFYKFHYALSLASTLKATGKDVEIFVSGYACNFIKKNWQDHDKEDINRRLKRKKMGSIEEMFAYCKELEIEIFYCESAIEFLNINIREITNLLSIKPKSMYSVLNAYKQGEIIFI
ncbi:MAG: DsrE family protein [Pseudomonadota bacterium]|nr:DsrE family protein [Pseudomonadota bacterium]